MLYRAHYQALELQIELTRRGIPYEIRSGTRFFEQRHVKDVLAFLRIVVNPKDELSWKRALKLFPRVGERSAAAVWEAIGSRPDPLAPSARSTRSARHRAAARSAALEAVPRAARAARFAGAPFALRPRRSAPVVEDVYKRLRPRASFPTATRAWTTSSSSPSSRRRYDSLPRVPRGGHALQRALGRGRRGGRSPRTIASSSPRSTRPRASSGAA